MWQDVCQIGQNYTIFCAQGSRPCPNLRSHVTVCFLGSRLDHPPGGFRRQTCGFYRGGEATLRRRSVRDLESVAEACSDQTFPTPVCTPRTGGPSFANSRPQGNATCCYPPENR